MILASVARHLYIRSGTGVGAFTKMYGGRKRRGTTPSIFCKADRGVIRRVLQSLEGLKLVEKDGNGYVYLYVNREIISKKRVHFMSYNIEKYACHSLLMLKQAMFIQFGVDQCLTITVSSIKNK